MPHRGGFSHAMYLVNAGRYCSNILYIQSYQLIDNQGPIANDTISPYLLALVYRYVSAIVPLATLLVLHAYGPWPLSAMR